MWWSHLSLRNYQILLLRPIVGMVGVMVRKRVRRVRLIVEIAHRHHRPLLQHPIVGMGRVMGARHVPVVGEIAEFVHHLSRDVGMGSVTDGRHVKRAVTIVGSAHLAVGTRCAILRLGKIAGIARMIAIVRNTAPLGFTFQGGQGRRVHRFIAADVILFSLQEERLRLEHATPRLLARGVIVVRETAVGKSFSMDRL